MTIDRSYFLNLTKAARAGMAHYAAPEDWTAAIEMIAKANREPGEHIEQAFARLTREDPTCRQLDAMRREALANAPVRKVGRPRKHKPGDVSLSKAEAALTEMAVKRAQRDGTSFEIAFVKTIDTEEGAPLYRQIREART